ncbi:hypothetical protein IMCC3135_16530 [Granulosicoccus antarcticus IMCC3135]|uniref:EamA domain-containing protein n=1 Tax=Granulosicoccus antarcticus IMCC3135 TaxID=1192854 RepID=A0A2Z2NUI1_9GAMM|nr:hypothetical protein IMCC3135_16530 [Granulosicoccus antarcticus IMCC3135]
MCFEKGRGLCAPHPVENTAQIDIHIQLAESRHTGNYKCGQQNMAYGVQKETEERQRCLRRARCLAGLHRIDQRFKETEHDVDSVETWVKPSVRFLWLTAFQAAGAVIAVTCITKAYRIGIPAYVAVFEYSFLIFASLWAFMLWGLPSNKLAMLGIAIILASGIALTLSTSRTRTVGLQGEGE